MDLECTSDAAGQAPFKTLAAPILEPVPAAVPEVEEEPSFTPKKKKGLVQKVVEGIIISAFGVLFLGVIIYLGQKQK